MTVRNYKTLSVKSRDFIFEASETCPFATLVTNSMDMSSTREATTLITNGSPLKAPRYHVHSSSSLLPLVLTCNIVGPFYAIDLAQPAT